MPYCVKCGVELDSEARACPLCLTPVILPGVAQTEPPRHAHPVLDPEDRENLSVSEGRLMAWEVLSVSFGIGALAVAIVDLAGSPGLGWSRYPLASLALVWLVLTSILRARRPSPAAFAVPALALPAYIIALDSFGSPRLEWSLSYGLPICLTVEAAVGLAALAIARSRRKGVNIAAIALIAIAAICFGIEITVDLASGQTAGKGGISLVWSSIVLASLLPSSLFLLYLHFRILHKKSLRRIFRI